MDLQLRGRTALVCSSTGGLGRATAQALAAEGVRVVISGRREVEAQQLADELPGSEVVLCDITDRHAADDLVTSARKKLDADIDIVILNGPGPRPAGATEVDSDDLHSAFEQLVVFQQRVTSLVLPGMRQRGWGRVLSIGSSGVVQPLRGLALSNIGRSALAAYLKTLATEVAADGVTVNVLLPGRIDTDRVRSLDADQAERTGQQSAEVAQQQARLIPAGRYGSPAEFGAVAAFLCSQQAGYVTGSAIRCDGGMVGHL